MSVDEVLNQKVQEAMEEFAFISTVATDDEASSYNGPVAMVELHAPVEGQFILCAPKELLQELVDFAGGGMLDSDSWDAQKDMLAEVANLIAGQIQSAYEAEVTIGLPVVDENASVECALRRFETESTSFWAAVKDAKSAEHAA